MRLWHLALCLLAVVLGAAPDSRAAEKPGERIHVTAGQMPAPYAQESASNSARRVARPPGHGLSVPPGFRSTLFAEGLDNPRWLAVAPNGDVFLAQSRSGEITLLRDSDGDGRADLERPFLSGLDRPHGMAFQPGFLYVADTRAVWRVPYRAGDLAAQARPEQVTADGALGEAGGHWTRELAFAPDGSRFFVAIGSRSNIAEEPAPRATIKVFPRDGGAGRIFASGLRNAVGIAFQPGTGRLHAVVNERDGLGDELVPDYLTAVEEGAFYGWPYAYIGSHPQPGFAERRPDLVAVSRAPDLLFRSHSAPIGFVFYDGMAFPDDYRGDAFVALQGSWNAAAPRGYMVVRVPFEDGRPAGWYEVFATGFRLDDVPDGTRTRATIWGRPAGLAVAADGALLVAESDSGTVWRIAPSGG